MTAQELKAARHSLGLSVEAFAQVIRIESGRTVRRWESGEQYIPGPVQILTDLMLRSAEVRKLLGLP
jgi:DNA-binding transcriptional regulator YiaG